MNNCFENYPLTPFRNKYYYIEAFKQIIISVLIKFVWFQRMIYISIYFREKFISKQQKTHSLFLSEWSRESLLLTSKNLIIRFVRYFLHIIFKELNFFQINFIISKRKIAPGLHSKEIKIGTQHQFRYWNNFEITLKTFYILMNEMIPAWELESVFVIYKEQCLAWSKCKKIFFCLKT